MIVNATWIDGHVTRAASFEGLTAKVAGLAWNEPYRGGDGYTMRRELARRAYVWSGTIVSPALPDRDFWVALVDAGLLLALEVRGEDGAIFYIDAPHGDAREEETVT